MYKKTSIYNTLRDVFDYKVSNLGDRENNYTLTMQANFDAFSKTLKTILSLQELYETSYTMLYDDFGQVHYETSSRGR